ncbi:MAG: NfeD family protein [Gammaproteobacteria bacterium]
MFKYFVYAFLFCLSSLAHAYLAVQLDVVGAIGPATQDYIVRGLHYAEDHHAQIVIIRLDTPGGLDASMRGIDRAILASTVPVVTFVAPEGARAASAGTYILYASHIAAMAPGTNLGAASPVAIGDLSTPEENKKTPSTMENKVKNDASAYIRSLAQMHGRNAQWAENAVRQASSLSADEAMKNKVIDLTARDVPELLQKINGRTVTVNSTQEVIHSNPISVVTVKPDWRYQFLSIITDPSIAYILLLIGIYGLFFEFYNPGLVLPGVAGVICLIIALYAFQLLPINYAGFSLLLLGIVFMIIEVVVSSFGIIGIGGIIAFVLGSIFLFDTNQPGFSIAWQLILMMGLLSAAFFFTIIHLAIGSMRKKVVTGREEIIGKIGEVLAGNKQVCQVMVLGEIWNARSTHHLEAGEKVRVTNISGLMLTVERVTMNKGRGD